jgi:hypothetical protein
MRLSIILAVLCLCLVACLPTPTSMPAVPTNTPLSTVTPTPTQVWFPPTATQTLFPTPILTPTLDIRPQVGEIILTDDFDDPSKWPLGQTASSSIAMGNNKLSLVLNQPGGYLFTLRREPTLSNFYLEITASPSLCHNTDEYGLLLRVSPALEFYRFSLSCDGQVRLDKYIQGRASSPQPWMMSGSVPPGAPSSSRLGVWTDGAEMHFYINDQYQFSVRDPALSSGSLGVFIRSAGNDTVSVGFSKLIVRKVE